jgi:putative endonuclease
LAFYTYLVECSNGSLYAGWTNDLDKRLQKHNSGQGAKYTRALRPVSLRAAWQFDTKNEAMSWEWQLKRMSRSEKLKLIQSET